MPTVRHITIRAVWLLPLCPILLLAACGNGSESNTATSNPSATATEKAPAPPTPPVQPGAQIVAEGTLSSTIIPGGTARFDPLTLPLNTGAEAPPCESYVFSFGWLVTDPYPAENVDLRWQWAREGSSEEIATGASGTASLGCGFLEAVNRGASKITLEAH